MIKKESSSSVISSAKLDKKESSPNHKFRYTILQSKASDFVPYNESTNKQNYSNFLDSVEKDAEEKNKFDDIFINPYENV